MKYQARPRVSGVQDGGLRGDVRVASYILGLGSIQIRSRPYPCQPYHPLP
ncbi:hypothetical protein BDFB_014610 [Asbolus verrucosus]|uniref:Uncharacterized protein n=1 Tax=Asbolus verrucosus TaxID=1661398 RepID=A0A482VB06_ASBVE|nr:hypothetical protein BDFB_014610 [Asbolus verrucosus]